MMDIRDKTIREIYEGAGKEGGRVVTWKTTTILGITCALLFTSSVSGVGLIASGYMGWGWISEGIAVLSLAFLIWFCCWYMAGKGRKRV